MYLITLSMLFATCILVANITAVKIIAVGSDGIDAGIITYPLTFLISDVISEVYGRKTATKVVWLGFLVNLVMVSTIFLAGKLPAATFWTDQPAYDTILGSVPRIVLGSMIAYIVSQNHDVIAFQMWRKFTKGRLLWVRNTASTLVSQGIDTFLFVIIAFSGLYGWDVLWSMIVLTYTIKALAAIADTPLVYLVTWYLKKDGQRTNN
jgi:uncharacterized integral membrane protein (TIGR00697 family)